MESSTPVGDEKRGPRIATIAWFSLTFLAWGVAAAETLLVAGRQAPETEVLRDSPGTPSFAAGMTVVCLLAWSVSVGCRISHFKLLFRALSRIGAYGASSLRRPELTRDSVAWCLAWMAQFNVVGVLLLVTFPWQAALPGLVLTALAEGWIFCKTFSPSRFRTLSWSATCDLKPPQMGIPRELEVPVTGVKTTEGDREQATNDLNQLSAMTDGIDENGRRYLAGWFRFSLEPAQKQISSVVAFCPAITGEAEAELECECETGEVDAEVDQISPAGMRVRLTRTVARDALDGILRWHVSEPELVVDAEGESGCEQSLSAGVGLSAGRRASPSAQHPLP